MKSVSTHSVIFLLLLLSACGDQQTSSNLGDLAVREQNIPEAPALEVKRDGADVTLSWNPVARATYYEVYRNTTNSASGVKAVKRSINNYQDAIDEETRYYYWVKACNGFGCSKFSDTKLVERGTIPQAPSPRADLSGDSVILSWDSTGDAGSYYKIYRDTTSDIAEPEERTAQHTGNSYQERIDEGTRYYYRIKACNSAGCSGYSEPASVIRHSIPAAPKLSATLEKLPATSDNSYRIDLNWDSSNDVVIYYQIYRNITDSTSDAEELLPRPSSGQTDYRNLISDGSTDTIYYYWIRACNDSGCSEYSELSAIIIIHPLNDTGITRSGNYPTGNSADCSGSPLPQDCNQGRDFTHEDGSDGHAGFRFSRIDHEGAYIDSNNYSVTPWSCVRDNVTGLIWEVKTNDDGTHDRDNSYRWGGLTAGGQTRSDREGVYFDSAYDDSHTTNYSWDSLVNHANTSELCTVSGWRVPSRAELLSIVNLGVDRSADAAIDTAYFPNTPTERFWTSTPYTSGNSNAWNVHFDSGYQGSSFRRGSHKVRLVSGESPAFANQWTDARYIVHGDGTVTDKRTALMWKQCAEGADQADCSAATAMNWQQALEAARNSVFAGHGNWRLPNRNELASLAALNRNSPSINSDIFPNTPADWFWTSSPALSTSDRSLYLNFENGYGNSYFRTHEIKVRLVRDVQ